MIRYVLAVLLTVAILAVAIPAVDRAATVNSEEKVESSVAKIDEAATSLAEQEDPSPEGHPPPQRTVTVRLPRDTFTSESVDHLEIERNGSISVGTYYFEGRTEKQIVIDQPIVYGTPEENKPVELGGEGEQELVLTLEEDPSGQPVVVVNDL